METLLTCGNPNCDKVQIQRTTPPEQQFKKCSICKTTRYCCKECQTIHWPIHKMDCRAQLEYDPSKLALKRVNQFSQTYQNDSRLNDLIKQKNYNKDYFPVLYLNDCFVKTSTDLIAEWKSVVSNTILVSRDKSNEILCEQDKQDLIDMSSQGGMGLYVIHLSPVSESDGYASKWIWLFPDSDKEKENKKEEKKEKQAKQIPHNVPVTVLECGNPECKNKQFRELTRHEHRFLQCVRCKVVRYCDKTCQTIDWPKHKSVCKTLQVESEPLAMAVKRTDKFQKTYQNDSRLYDLIAQVHQKKTHLPVLFLNECFKEQSRHKVDVDWETILKHMTYVPMDKFIDICKQDYRDDMQEMQKMNAMGAAGLFLGYVSPDGNNFLVRQWIWMFPSPSISSISSTSTTSTMSSVS